ncbi:MAG: metallophosphoesterase family protein [Anaerolineales bacterium]|nr:metallophosphoesterase family protein [Anaerolineales bacterium]MCB9127994.1 metallophosphoesterase family protein [Ardenticatenales bacterium]MCB9172010.1 metallophosphoesterase family protein [Ardenticatenales bacterium]
MRILILSDIHANLAALEAVLATPEAAACDQLWCLGDTVGYGPNPNECVALMQRHATVALCGNHDLAALGRTTDHDFNRYAQRAIDWTAAQLSPSTHGWLSELPSRRDDVHSLFSLCHASPRDPVWEYVTDAELAAANFPHFDQRFALVGHTHYPAIFRQDESALVAGYYPMPEYELPLGTEGAVRFIINPGSVGQPRDQDPRASFALFDDEAITLTYHRVDYDIAATQRQMRAAGLPKRLVERLEIGW